MNCEECFGPTEKDCITCNPPFYLGNYSICLYLDCTNYLNTFPNEKSCKKCEDYCDRCSGSKDNCSSCAPPFLFPDPDSNACLVLCPPQFYTNYHLQLCQRMHIIYIYIYM